jgi:hypothetical protein
VLGAFEHHVLEEVGKASAAGQLVERTDVVPEIDGDQRKTVVFMRDDSQAVGQRVLLVRDVRKPGGGHSGMVRGMVDFVAGSGGSLPGGGCLRGERGGGQGDGRCEGRTQREHPWLLRNVRVRVGNS